MFKDAYKIACHFTHPVILSRKTIGGQCSSSIGAFVVINDGGWIVTAGHMLESLSKLKQETDEARSLETQRAAIRADPSLTEKEKRKAIGKLRKLPKEWTDRWSVWWAGWSGTNLVQATGLTVADVAVARLAPFDPTWIKTYPVFKDPSKDFGPGTSLCKIGFPFHSITPRWDDSTGNFELPAGALPIPFFPIEGIFTRTAEALVHGGNPVPFPIRWVETSTPGLRGQSGGPTIDRQGTIWAIQCKTAHLPLGFNPPVPGGRPGETEHQFLSVGLGVHPDTLFGLFGKVGIKFAVSSY